MSLLDDSVEDFAPLVNCQPSLTSGGQKFCVVNGKLDLSGICLDFNDVAELARLISTSSSLQTLKLCFNSLCPLQVKVLCKALKKNTSIENFTLGWNERIQTKGISYVAKMLTKNKTIREVTLHKNYINDEGAAFLFDLLKTNTTITHLSLHGNKITSVGAKKLAKSLKTNTTLEHLDLRSNLVEADGALHIVKALFKNTTLQTLDLGYNSIGPLGALSFGELLLTRPSLTQLGLAGNAIDDCVDSLYQAIELNSKLKVIDLRFNKIPPIPSEVLETATCEVIFSPKDVAPF